MKKTVVITSLSGLALLGFGVGIYSPEVSFSAELDGFAINTQEKAVTVTLYTDQRVPYTTEHQGKQFSIILPGTQLSEQQINNGLPVVIDNKNRFIGRAVPTEDGKVKIILPNLPANEYSVSIQQKPQEHTTVSNDRPNSLPLIKPRPAITASPAISPFEQAATASMANKTTPSPPRVVNLEHAGESPLRLSPTPDKPFEFRPGSASAIWNPYVVRQTRTAYSNYKPVARRNTSKPQSAENLTLEDLPESNNSLSLNSAPLATNTHSPEIKNVSIEEALNAMNASPSNPVAAAPNQHFHDPLWYLHSLSGNMPPANSINDNALNGPALQGGLPMLSSASLANTDSQPASSPKADAKQSASGKAGSNHAQTFMHQLFQSIPHWLLWTLAFCLGGIGLFSVAGGLVLFKVLFSAARQQLGHLPMGATSPIALPPEESLSPAPAQSAPKSRYITPPGRLSGKPLFPDTAAISALDYLKQKPDTVSQAVQNTVFANFPPYQKPRAYRQKQRLHPSVSKLG